MKKTKLVMIGLDAADRRLVRTWADEGYLPTVASLLKAGVTAQVATPLAVLEGGVWPTFLTSTSPVTHGVLSSQQLRPGTYDLEVRAYADRLTVTPFWAHLGRAGKRVAVIDVPFARPVRRLNGIQVTNWGSHDPWSWQRSSWPPRLITDLVNRFGDHPVAVCDATNRTVADYEDLRARLIAGVERKAALLRHCLAMDDWDFFFGVFSESHCAGHQFWHFMDPTHPRHDPSAAATLRWAIRDVYRALDAAVMTVLEGAPPEAHVLLMLSHGMGPYYAGSHLLDSVLERLGINGNGEAALSPDGAGPYPGRRRLWGMRQLLPAPMRQIIKDRLARPVRQLWTWTHAERPARSRMRAFAIPSNNMTGAIRINVKGRDPAGLVGPGAEYETLCRELTEALLALENAETGRPAVQWVRRADELYQGPRLSELPDLFVEWDHGAPIRTLRSPRIGTLTGVFGGRRTGDHWQGGWLVGRGPRFRAGQAEGDIRTQDIGPTVLEFFDLPAPRAYEGKSRLALLRRA